MNIIKFLKQYQADLILALAIILISITAFNMGKISAIKHQKSSITITGPTVNEKIETANPQNAQRSTLNASSVVASKNSTSKLYHFPWCASGYRITAINRIYFNTAEEAEKAGYTLAGNCHP